MSDHMAPNRLEPARRDDYGGNGSSRRRPPRQRAVPDYEFIEQPPDHYPSQLDSDYTPGTYPPGENLHAPRAESASGSNPSLRLDRGAYNRPPLEMSPQSYPNPTVGVRVDQTSEVGYEYDYDHYSHHESEAARRDGDTNPVPTFPRESVDDERVYVTPPEDAAQQPSIMQHTEVEAGNPAPVPAYRELHAQLMHTIQLYNDDWKLGGIRTNDNRLVAYLTPRNKKLDLKEAIHRREVLVIMVDSLGNTDVKEPRPRGILGRFKGWFIGD